MTGTALRDRPTTFLRAHLGALASRGETSGPRVEAARAALTWQRRRAFLIHDMGLAPERADDLLDQIEDGADDALTEARTEPEADARTEAEAVSA